MSLYFATIMIFHARNHFPTRVSPLPLGRGAGGEAIRRPKTSFIPGNHLPITHPRTAPNVNPLTKCRCTSKLNTNTGKVATTANADACP